MSHEPSDLDDALTEVEELSQLVRDFQQMSSMLPTQVSAKLRLPLRNLPAVAAEEPPPPSRRVGLAPSELLALWKRHGTHWLHGLTTQGLRSLGVAWSDPQWGPPLLADLSFVLTALPLVNERLRRDLLARAWFLTLPPRRELRPSVEQEAGNPRHRAAPTWWQYADRPDRELVDALRRALDEHHEPTLPHGWGVPTLRADNPWAVAIVQSSPPPDFRHADKLLTFADEGNTLNERASVRGQAQQSAVRAMAALGDRHPASRSAIVQRLKQRVGPIEGAAVAWAALPEVRQRLRAWAVTGLLELIFVHLVPTNQHSHQTAPRKAFWAQYADQVVELHLFLAKKIEPRMESGEVKIRLEQARGLVTLHSLTDSSERAVLWMFFTGTDGQELTVSEGNFNTACLLVNRRVPVPSFRCSYNDLVHRLGPEKQSKSHHRGWEAGLESLLESRGLSATSPADPTPIPFRSTH